MGPLTVDELRFALGIVRFLLFLGIMLYFVRIRRQIPKTDRGASILIAGFAAFSLASLVNSVGLMPTWLTSIGLEAQVNNIILTSHIGYLSATLVVVYGLLHWANSVVKLHAYAAETEEVRQQLHEQNRLLQETTRDLEERTIDYIGQREAAIESERSKTNFLRNTSHELRTPLNAIIGLSDILSKGTVKKEEEQVEFSKMILDAGKKLLKTLDTVLEISRIKSNEYSPTLKSGKIRDVIDECVTHCLPKAQSKSIKLSILPESDKDIQAIFDYKASHHIMTRILNNAVTHSPENTRVTIDVQMTAKKSVEIIVADQGPGIDPEFMDSIFEVFGKTGRWQNRGEDGTGLGLALASKMAEIQNGSLTIESDGKNGTTCTLTLEAENALEACA